MTPTFKMHGSKARTAKWIASHFPTKFNRLIEPFAGRGNVFFRSCSECDFNSVVLNDTNTGPFLKALRDYKGDYSFVDAGEIGKVQWQAWRDAPPSHERAMAESYVARFGSSYDTGPTKAGGDSANGHSRDNTIRRFKAGGELLRQKDAQIFELDWKSFVSGLEIKEGDVVYLDPPYDVPQHVHYGNINHDELLEWCKSLACPVYITGYTSPRYESALADWNRETRVRASVGKGVASTGAKGFKPRVEEVLWWKNL